jgi:hypothetical protein
MRSQRGFTGGEILIVLLIVGALGWGASKTLPIFNGDSRRAKAGQESTAALNKAHDAPAAANTASAEVIGRAAAKLPDSPAATFIKNEVPIMLARGPVPDALELLAAEKRLNVYLSGQLDEARNLHGKALEQAGDLRAELAKAKATKRSDDDEISTAAAEKLAANRAALGFGAVAALALAAFVWVKLQAGGVSATLARIVPALETAYNSADKKSKDILDRTVFATLDGKLDLAQKKLIRRIKDRT